MSKGFGTVQRKIAEVLAANFDDAFESMNFAGKFTASIGLRKSNGYRLSERPKR